MEEEYYVLFTSIEISNIILKNPDFGFLNPFQKIKIFSSSIWLFLLAKCMFSRVLNRMESTSLKWKMFSFWVIRFLKSLIYILYMYLWKWNYTKTKQFLPKRSWFHSIQHPQKHIFSHLEQPNWWKKNLEFLKISKSRIQNIKSCITPDLLIRFSLNFVCKCLDTFKNCYEHQFFPSYIFLRN